MRHFYNFIRQKCGFSSKSIKCDRIVVSVNEKDECVVIITLYTFSNTALPPMIIFTCVFGKI